jgi:hypothetical protein
MRESGLSIDTIRRCRAWTEYDGDKLRRGLSGVNATPPALVLPFFDALGDAVGNWTGYAVVRMMPPHVRPDGREAKYLMPAGLPNRAYFPPFPLTWEAVNTPGRMFVITEGILKALSSTQAGIPCIGLMGMWNWHEPRERDADGKPFGPRRLIDDLARIDWTGRPVLIVCDADPIRKPLVHLAAVELARLLTELGAPVFLPRLPLGPRDNASGLPLKQAVDDYIVRDGEPAWRELVGRWLAEPEVVPLDTYRAEMHRARFDCWRLNMRGSAYVGRRLGSLSPLPHEADCGPTGSGKSYRDMSVIREMEEMSMRGQACPPPSRLAAICESIIPPRSLTVVPTHAHCEDVVSEAAEQGVTVVPYPKLAKDTCEKYTEAKAVMKRGLAFQLALCPECAFRDDCPYRAQRLQAEEAQHAVATQARYIHTAPRARARRNLIVLHEKCLDVVAHTILVTQPLGVIETIAHGAEHRASSPADRAFYRRMGQIARQLDGYLRGADKSAEVPLPEPLAHVPANLHADINEAVLAIGPGIVKRPEAMRLVLAAATGELTLVGVGVDTLTLKGKGENGTDKASIERRLTGVLRGDLPPGSWLNDATAEIDDIERTCGRVKDITPPGRLLRHHPVLQIIPERDVTKGRTAKSVLPQLLGLLHELPHKRIGLVTHRRHAEELLDLLSEEQRRRLAKVHHFGGGESRGSNAWIDQCDALIVLGTPRVRPADIRSHLFRVSKVRAAERTEDEAGWGIDYWSGVDENGKRRTVRCWHYADHDWHAAYSSLTRSELVQAIGRGRGILPSGIPVYVVSTENLAPPWADDGRNGFPLAEEGQFLPLSEPEFRVLQVFMHANRVIVRAPDIARELGLTTRQIQKTLRGLEVARRVVRMGQRGGWGLGQKVDQANIPLRYI